MALSTAVGWIMFAIGVFGISWIGLSWFREIAVLQERIDCMNAENDRLREMLAESKRLLDDSPWRERDE